MSMTEEERNTVAREIYCFFVKNGFSSEQAAGIVGNVQAESNFDIHCVGDGGLAMGLWQMHPDRRTIIKQHLGVSMATGSVDDQCSGVLWELKYRETHAMAMLRASKTAFDAGHDFCRYYERPASATQWSYRGKLAEAWLGKFKVGKLMEPPIPTKPIGTGAVKPAANLDVAVTVVKHDLPQEHVKLFDTFYLSAGLYAWNKWNSFKNFVSRHF